jgi:hypothetical protein
VIVALYNPYDHESHVLVLASAWKVRSFFGQAKSLYAVKVKQLGAPKYFSLQKKNQ